MFLEEYDEAKHLATVHQEGYEEGHNAGEKRGSITALYMYAGFTPEQIAEKTGTPLSEVMKIIQEV